MSFFQQKHIEQDEYYHKERVKLAFRLSILFSSLFFILALFEFFNSTRNFVTYLFCTIFPLLHILYLKKTNKYELVYLSFCLIGTSIAFYTINNFVEEVHYGDILWMLLIIILAFWGINNLFGIIFLVLNLLSINYYLFVNAQENFITLRELDTTTKFAVSLEVSIAFIAITFIIYQFVTFYRFSLKRMNEINEKLVENNQIVKLKNNENILLLKEVHHRVKNNLQIITSLLRLQKQSLEPDTSQKFDEAINRIMTMALIHRKLYQSDDLSQVNMESYIQDLILEITNTYSLETEVHTKFNSSYNNKIGLNTIVPLGLMINELLSNSFKHAFLYQKTGQITISLSELPAKHFEFSYTDNGLWKFSEQEKNKFGMELLETLTEQLEGTYYREDSNYIFKLKNLDI